MSRSRGVSNLGADQFVSARRTESIDSAAVAKLISTSTEQVFGRINIVNLIERANLAVTLVNQDDELMGQACFFDYPNTPEVDPGQWEDWLPSRYKKTTPSGSLNSLFLHFFVARGEYSHGAAKEIITTVFTAVPEVHYIYLMVPKTAYPEVFDKEASLSNIFSQLEVNEESPGLDKHVLFVCKREKFVPMLHVRRARVQDHDDLTPIFDRQSNMLSNTYGDFFLAELIEAQDESMHCLVSEIEGAAVGFMSLCTEVNLDLLNRCFDLGPLHGLRKPHPDDVTAAAPEEPEIEENPIPLAKPDSGKSVKSHTSGQVVDEQGKGELAIQRKLSEEMLDYMSDVSGSLSTSRASSVIEKPEACVGGVEEPLQPADQSKKEPSLPKTPSKFVPEFHGESNAFSIQLFCIDEQYEMRSLDLLREAFAKMPDKEFAVMTVPHLVPEFPLLQKFLRVTPRITSNLSQELYVFHKMGLTEDFIVRDAVKEDTEGIESLIQTLTHKDNLKRDLIQYFAARRDPDGTELRAYVAEVCQQIVGISIIRAEQDIEYIRSHYNIEDFIYFNHHARSEHGHLHHFALNPIFNHFTKHFIKEILRKAHKTSLYYPVFPSTGNTESMSCHSMLTCMNEMVPVKPRRQIIYPLDVLEDRAPSKRVLQKRELYALCHVNRKLTLEPKVAINARIVVVGASTVAMAYLETLAFCPHLKFNNLVLISPHGLPGELGPDPLRDNLLGTEHCYSEEDHSNISLRSWVSVVYGKMTKIDRMKKQVYVNGSKLVSYDHLIIATGEQHQYPMPTGIEPNSTVELPPAHPDRWFVGVPPKNLFVVNDDYDAAVSLFWIEQNIVNKQKSGKIVVHGSTLRSYTTIQALVQLGVTPSDIVLVKTPESGPTCFNDPVIDAAVKACITEEYGMTVEEGAILGEWNVDEENKITELTFLTPEGTFTTACSALFSYTTKRVDLDAFQAVNDACLVFDGKLVIDSTFHTNDISIRSAGSLTKYQRRYHSEPWTHKNFNSKEVGVEIASAMLILFDPTLESVGLESDEDPLKLIPMYRSPKVQGGYLPGGLHYLHVIKPSLEIPLAIHMMNPEYGSVLCTGEPVGKSKETSYVENFFRLHFNAYNTVETVTCLSKNEIEVSNLLCLYGVHQRFLNNVMQRYKEGLIKDFYSFFREAWVLAIYHDRFSDFRDEIRELLVNQPAPDVKALEVKVRELIEEDLQLSAADRKNIHELYADTSVKRAVETRLLSYLSYNYNHLPMYAKPGMV